MLIFLVYVSYICVCFFMCLLILCAWFFSVLLFAFFVFACLLLKSDKDVDLGEAELRDRKAVIRKHCINTLFKMGTY